MGSNSFGTVFKITTWGESHGSSMGVVVDGCPAGLAISEEEIAKELRKRRPGASPLTSPRNEKDAPKILSGIFEGKTTGAPISISIENGDADPSKYEKTKDLLRPGHANYTYLKKYGIFDHRGGGRSSGRETVARVAAGAIAKQILKEEGIKLFAYIKQIGSIKALSSAFQSAEDLEKSLIETPFPCTDPQALRQMAAAIEKIKEEGDSLGGIVECIAFSLPPGLGDPIYEKLEAKLACAMLSIPAVKGIEFGTGFAAAELKGSENNDLFEMNKEGAIRTKTNHSGGMLGGISNGMPLLFRVAFKPPSSIFKPQETLTLEGAKALYETAQGSRHDPTVAIRGVPVVEAMTAIVLADCFLMQRLAKWD